MECNLIQNKELIFLLVDNDEGKNIFFNKDVNQVSKINDVLHECTNTLLNIEIKCREPSLIKNKWIGYIKNMGIKNIFTTTYQIKFSNLSTIRFVEE